MKKTILTLAIATLLTGCSTAPDSSLTSFLFKGKATSYPTVKVQVLEEPLYDTSIRNFKDGGIAIAKGTIIAATPDLLSGRLFEDQHDFSRQADMQELASQHQIASVPWYKDMPAEVIKTTDDGKIGKVSLVYDETAHKIATGYTWMSNIKGYRDPKGNSAANKSPDRKESATTTYKVKPGTVIIKDGYDNDYARTIHNNDTGHLSVLKANGAIWTINNARSHSVTFSAPYHTDTYYGKAYANVYMHDKSKGSASVEKVTVLKKSLEK